MIWRRSSRCDSGMCVEVTADVWQKASTSGFDGNCVEVGGWTKSLASGSDMGCVELADCSCGVLVRDSKNPDGPRLSFDAISWTAFLDAMKAGEFDLGRRLVPRLS